MRPARGLLTLAIPALGLPCAAHAEPVPFRTVAETGSVPATVQLTGARPLFLGSITTEHSFAMAAAVKDEEGAPVLPAGGLPVPSSKPQLFWAPQRRSGVAGFTCLKDAGRDDAFGKVCRLAVDLGKALAPSPMLGQGEPTCGPHLAKPPARRDLVDHGPIRLFVALRLTTMPTAEDGDVAEHCLTWGQSRVPQAPCDDFLPAIPLGHFGDEANLQVAGARHTFLAAPARPPAVPAPLLRLGQPFPDVGSS
jgi:hypothetical protein